MIYVILSALIIAADQFLKSWISGHVPVGDELALIPGLVRITNVHNTGAAFSLFEGMQLVILIITGLFSLAAIFALITRMVKSVFGNITLAFILGGALGNFIDRILSGYVVDMFDFQFVNFAVFNIADIFITCGAVLFCLFVILSGKKSSTAQGSTSIKNAKADVSAEPEAEDYSLDKIIDEFTDISQAKQDTKEGDRK